MYQSKMELAARKGKISAMGVPSTLGDALLILCTLGIAKKLSNDHFFPTQAFEFSIRKSDKLFHVVYLGEQCEHRKYDRMDALKKSLYGIG